MGRLLPSGLAIGIGATILIDLWALFLARLFGQNRPNWALVGRWFGHLREGEVFHEDIALAEPCAGELGLGWTGHYVVGAIYGVAFVLMAGQGWLAEPRLLPAWLFGIATLAFGWFLLQPGMGLGWAASRTPQPGKVRLLNLVSHSVFGLGLYLSALILP